MALVNLAVQVPEDRVPEFYSAFADWLHGRNAAREARPGRRAPRSPGPSRYDGIGEYLKQRTGPECTVSFADLEIAIDAELPASALKHRAWWANTDRNTQARVWMNAGWHVTAVDFDNENVQFEYWGPAAGGQR